MKYCFFNLKQSKAFIISLLFFYQSVNSTVINDIRIEGLQRVSSEVIFSVLPLSIGDSLDEVSTADISRAIFATGLFEDIEIGVNNNLLILKIEERPSISEITIDGNEAIDTQVLLDGLKDQGMAEGQVFKQAILDGMRRELIRQYSLQGRYDAEIDTIITEQPRNRVAIKIEIDEGKGAKIHQIKFIGNKQYNDKDILSLMELKYKGIFNKIRGRNKYSREKLSGDLEAIKDLYLNTGYLQYNLQSVQVSVGPKKDSVYITIILNEGERFKVNKLSIAGDIKNQANKLEQVYLLKEDSIFSQAYVTQTEELMKKVMGNDGFNFAEVEGILDINKEEKSVDITFFIDPGKRTYVRRIDFMGNTKTEDQVLRREMRQIEGAIASTELIELSRNRLDRLGFFKEVKVENKNIPGVEDMIDVLFEVEEQPSGSISASLGFSQDIGMIYGVDFQQNNFLGTGDRVSLSANRSQFRTLFSFSHNDPYFTEDGVSRGFNLFYTKTNFEEINIASYSANKYGANVSFGYPINETQRFSFNLGFENTEIVTGPNVIQEISRTPIPGIVDANTKYTIIDPNLNGDIIVQTNTPIDPTDTVNQYIDFDTSLFEVFPESEQGFVDREGDSFNIFPFTIKWRQSALNRGMLATRGYSQNLSLKLAAPGSDVQYGKLSYDGQIFFPLGKYTLRLTSELGYGFGYGSSEELPFFEHFLAGGLGSVRGFETNSLGPYNSPAKEYVLTDLYDENDYIDIPLFDDNGDPIVDSNGAQQFIRDYTTLLSAGAYQQNSATGELITRDISGSRRFGGNILFEGSVELLFPLPFLDDQRSVRSALFYDFGNVFSTNCLSTQINCSDFDLGQLRSSVGIGITWLSGFGPLSFSISNIIDKQPLDRTENFQFSIGRVF